MSMSMRNTRAVPMYMAVIISMLPARAVSHGTDSSRIHRSIRAMMPMAGRRLAKAMAHMWWAPSRKCIRAMYQKYRGGLSAYTVPWS